MTIRLSIVLDLDVDPGVLQAAALGASGHSEDEWDLHMSVTSDPIQAARVMGFAIHNDLLDKLPGAKVLTRSLDVEEVADASVR